MSYTLDGRAIGARIREKVKARVNAMPVKPGLAVILVGDDPASHLYVSLKRRACEEAGIRFELHAYPANEPEATLLASIDELNQRHDVTGILVQLPLPSQDPYRVIDRIRPDKDVDGFHRENVRALAEGRPMIVSALALGIIKLIDKGREALGREALGREDARTAAIVGSALFAEPLRYLFAEQDVFAERVDPDDAELERKTRTADILIVCVGRPGYVVGGMVKPGAIVIDVGTTKVDGRVVGDVDAASVTPVAGALSPVPGGVGPMTVAMLLLNVVKAREMQGGKFLHPNF
jgi:methylenetetrahydrofolate dehydrogenase (NADP+)/methenyltetrahydrofolate cyclohydrolase